MIYERGCDLAENMPSFRVIKSEYLFTSKDKKQNGLVGEYFNNSDLEGKPSFTRVDKQINFAWWDKSPSPTPSRRQL